jgi:hypothetical protein
MRIRDTINDAIAETSQETPLSSLPATWVTRTTFTGAPASAYGTR